MNGPESSTPKGNPMEQDKLPRAPEKLVMRASQWTEADREVGQKLLTYVDEKIDTKTVSDFYAQISRAGRALQLLGNNQTFGDLPKKVKSYLSFIRKERMRREQPLGINVEDATSEWYRNLEGDRNAQHGLDPDSPLSDYFMSGTYQLENPDTKPNRRRVLR